MDFSPFSKKQLSVLTWWLSGSKYCNRDALICDGAVRSGKTLCMSISFVLWAFWTFNGHSFAICGKTVTSLKRNIIVPLCQQLTELGFSCSLKTASNYMDVSVDGRSNRFYFFGGKDESSAALIQGMTLSGAMLDEVALMPRSFVEQCIARCSVKGSKFWFNCNPENPHHWFYTEWIKRCDEKNALYLHFTMEDNPSLSPDIVDRYRSLYSGTFFERFVLGKWVAAEGLVYPQFDRDRHFTSPPKNCDKYYISCDYGTVNPSSFGLWGRHDGVWYRLREYYYSSRRSGEQKTDEEYYAALEGLADSLSISAVICDPSAASFMTCIRRHGKFKVLPADNNVVDGIRKVAGALKDNKIKFVYGCNDTLREFSLYRWDESAGCDRPIKENDHAMDDIRYFVTTVVDNDVDNCFAVAVQR